MYSWGPRDPGCDADAGPGDAFREDGPVKTRTLLILAFVTGLLILAAGALQIFLGTR